MSKKSYLSKLNILWTKVTPFIKNKYIVTGVLFTVFFVFFIEYSLVERFSYLKKRNNLKENNLYYIEQIAEDEKLINELKTNNENLEKFARENYLMKKDNEDIFIIEYAD